MISSKIKYGVSGAFVLLFGSVTILHAETDNDNFSSANADSIQVVAELPFRPGNVTVSKTNEVYLTRHPFSGPDQQLIKMTGKSTYVAFPDSAWQTPWDKQPESKSFDSPLGVVIDSINRLWVIDCGFRLNQTRLFAFDLSNGNEVFNMTLPSNIAPPESFVQDLAVDAVHGWVYLADIATPGIIAIDIINRQVRKISGHPGFLAEDMDMIIDSSVVYFKGKPARVGINPITLSADGQTLFFGAMSSKKWYGLPTHFFREHADDRTILGAIYLVGEKPISDGATTDAEGNHFFTSIESNGIDLLPKNEKRTSTLLRDNRFSWPDNVHFGPDSWLFISVNQLHKMPIFYKENEQQKDRGVSPYYIYKTNTGTAGQIGR